jgi:GNAT superfamily N-acetyltransferase
MWVMSELVPHRASPDEWRRYHVFRRRQLREWRPEDPIPPDDVAELRLRRGDPTKLERYWQATVGGETVSLLETEATRPGTPEYETSRHLLYATAYVLRSHRGRGVGRAWIPTILALMDGLGATVLTSAAEDDSGRAFLGGLGAEPRMSERRSRLDLRRVDWDMVERWVREGEERSPAARLEVYPNRVPDHLLPEYDAACTELLNTMPFEDLDHGRIVVTPDWTREWYAQLEETASVVHTCIVRGPDGSIVGMTDVLRHSYEPGLVHQLFTGVHPRARGRRIGRWLKAAMLRHLRRAHPDTVAMVTENVGSNRWMLDINEALGFRPERVVTYYQLTRDRLAATRPPAPPG